jgi:hypothetical protein
MRPPRDDVNTRLADIGADPAAPPPGPEHPHEVPAQALGFVCRRRRAAAATAPSR